ncbi:hypothetical protein [Arthrobacter sp. SAFR-044]|uniref:hypothetical protein n=1 Tax=Arthrobacter sp. SAFR-044 TaxID=3387278 RepID=UPI003F7CA6BC
MNDYSETMKTPDIGPMLRKLTEQARDWEWPTIPARPQERFYEEHALLGFLAESGWAIGIRLDFSDEDWSVAEVLALPGETARGLPDLNTPDLRSYLDKAVDRARIRRSAMIENRERALRNSEFVDSRFETWADKSMPKGNVEYAALAAKYAEQVRLGNSKATATLAQQVGVSAPVMAQRVKEARRRLLLSSGDRGRASGSLTPLGALYTDPEFPGMRELFKSRMRIGEIADKYGLDERWVWAGMQAERPDGGGLPLGEFDEFIASVDEGR